MLLRLKIVSVFDLILTKNNLQQQKLRLSFIETVVLKNKMEKEYNISGTINRLFLRVIHYI